MQYCMISFLLPPLSPCWLFFMCLFLALNGYSMHCVFLVSILEMDIDDSRQSVNPPNGL